MVKIAISQPRYLPALNYLQRIAISDIFVLLDNVQRQSRGIENRNKILVNGRPHWLTIPITSSSREKIQNTIVSKLDWLEKHKKTIHMAYSRHPYYDYDLVETYYENLDSTSYVDIVESMLNNLCKIFDIKPYFIRASSLSVDQNIKGVENLYNISKHLGASIYISGSNGRNYGVKEKFAGGEQSIRVMFHDFNYPVYKQFNNKQKYHSWLCFFDPLFNLGVDNIKELLFSKPLLREI